MSKIFLFDAARCTGCYNCQLACKDEHCGNNWLPYASRQPMTGQFWCKVSEHVQGSIPKVKMYYTVRLCAHCADAACMKVCPVKAISRREDGFVLIDPGKCAGCGACERACPTAPSTSMRNWAFRRNAQAAPICWTTVFRHCPAAWTPAPRMRCCLVKNQSWPMRWSARCPSAPEENST